MPGAITVDGLQAWVRGFAALIGEHAEHLTRLDSAIGDGDHGINMNRGMLAVLAALDDDPPGTATALFKQVGMTLVSTVGGAAGPLYGTFFLRMSAASGDAGELDAAGFAKALRAGVDGVVARGKADGGDKTMYDALAPAADTLDERLAGGDGLRAALEAAAAAADQGRDATKPMLARKGRASYLGERSIGHLDPGAVSAALLVRAAASTAG